MKVTSEKMGINRNLRIVLSISEADFNRIVDLVKTERKKREKDQKELMEGNKSMKLRGVQIARNILENEIIDLRKLEEKLDNGEFT